MLSAICFQIWPNYQINLHMPNVFNIAHIFNKRAKTSVDNWQTLVSVEKTGYKWWQSLNVSNDDKREYNVVKTGEKWHTLRDVGQTCQNAEKTNDLKQKLITVIWKKLITVIWKKLITVIWKKLITVIWKYLITVIWKKLITVIWKYLITVIWKNSSLWYEKTHPVMGQKEQSKLTASWKWISTINKQQAFIYIPFFYPKMSFQLCMMLMHWSMILSIHAFLMKSVQHRCYYILYFNESLKC